ncbi:hypothetical protein [Bordetella sp. N]|nr:hypothetical protein [Bordetella sp. N]
MLRVKRSSTEALLAQLVSCRAAMHPYDPGSSTQDVSGCIAAIPDSMLRA